MTSRGLRPLLLVGLIGTMVAAPIGSAAFADSGTLSAARSWSGSWAPASTAERTYRLTVMDTQKKLETGFYDDLGKTTTNNYYDSSVGAVTITGEEGASVDLEIRTTDGTGNTTTTNSIGATNTSQTNISVEGAGNSIDVTNAADSIGCQDGSIQTSSTLIDGVDISAGASTSSGASNSSGDSSC